MNKKEFDKAKLFLTEAFPNTEIADGQMEVFQAAVKEFTLDEVIEGIKGYAARTMFPNPTVAEIVTEIKCLMRREVSGSIKKFHTAMARSVVALNPAWAQRPEREVIVCGHHANWQKYLDWVLASARVRNRQANDEELQRIDRQRIPAKRQCAGDLRIAKQAENPNAEINEAEIDTWASAAVIDGIEEFKLTVKQLRGDPVPDAAMSY